MNGPESSDGQTRSTAWCPSARPETPGAVVLGVRAESGSDARVGYLSELVPVTEDLLALADPVSPLEVFRFGAPCAESACVHFDGARCGLVSRIVAQVPVAVDIAPACAFRSRCRWWRQEGVAACRRCPVVLTSESGRQVAVAAAAQPDLGPRPSD